MNRGDGSSVDKRGPETTPGPCGLNSSSSSTGSTSTSSSSSSRSCCSASWPPFCCVLPQPLAHATPPRFPAKSLAQFSPLSLPLPPCLHPTRCAPFFRFLQCPAASLRAPSRLVFGSVMEMQRHGSTRYSCVVVFSAARGVE